MSSVYAATSLADYSRFEQTPFRQGRLSHLACVVVGAGALGNEVTRTLGLLGSARVYVVDPDLVEPGNLPRSTFFWGRDTIGRNKAIALVEAASTLFPDTEWLAFDREIADVGFQNLENADIVFSCVDSDLARIEIAYISTKLGIPVADGGLGTPNYSHGRVTYFPATDGTACYGCLLSARKRRELLELWHATVRPCAPVAVFDAQAAVSTPMMASVVGSIQVDLGLRHLFQSHDGIAVECNTLVIRLNPERQMTEFRTSVSVDCPFHQHVERNLQPLALSDDTFEDLLNRTGANSLVLDWPLCTEALCQDCQTKWSPMLRLAALRRRGYCPACESRNILELQVIRTIDRDSPWIGFTASSLKLPADHLHTLQFASGL